ncbi:MAG: hypothetical protein KDE08_16455 [Rhodobacteraceae bacterium]|nr:hypothetical protein [Paracoccaceae bacterium]
MTNRLLAVSAPESDVQTMPRGFLRIAVPTWRNIAADSSASAETDPTLSREEIQNLFEGELIVSAMRSRSMLTNWERQEKSLALRLRRALYPEVAKKSWRH